jgi:hypothetical protein
LYSSHLKVEIRLQKKSEGGRDSALPRDEWKTVLKCKDENWSALLRYEGTPEPGDFFKASVTFLSPKLALPNFFVGSTFTVLEIGCKGEGTVLSTNF